MWQLLPAPGAEDGGEPVTLLGSGVFSLGRPAKAVKSQEALDVVITGDASVSKLHARLELAADGTARVTGARSSPSAAARLSHRRRRRRCDPRALRLRRAPARAHFPLAPADVSRFGTYIDGVRLAAGQPAPLLPGATLKLGYKHTLHVACRRLVWLLPSASSRGGAAAAEELRDAAARAGAEAAASWSPRVTHAFAAEGEAATPALVAALLAGAQLVTPAW
jgi:hypothetical protein